MNYKVKATVCVSIFKGRDKRLAMAIFRKFWWTKIQICRSKRGKAPSRGQISSQSSWLKMVGLIRFCILKGLNLRKLALWSNAWQASELALVVKKKRTRRSNLKYQKSSVERHLTQTYLCSNLQYHRTRSLRLPPFHQRHRSSHPRRIINAVNSQATPWRMSIPFLTFSHLWRDQTASRCMAQTKLAKRSVSSSK